MYERIYRPNRHRDLHQIPKKLLSILLLKREKIIDDSKRILMPPSILMLFYSSPSILRSSKWFVNLCDQNCKDICFTKGLLYAIDFLALLSIVDNLLWTCLESIGIRSFQQCLALLLVFRKGEYGEVSGPASIQGDRRWIESYQAVRGTETPAYTPHHWLQIHLRIPQQY